MTKTKQVMKVATAVGTFTVVYHEGMPNPYRMYLEHDGVKTLWEKYADFYSCICFFHEALKPR